MKKVINYLVGFVGLYSVICFVSGVILTSIAALSSDEVKYSITDDEDAAQDCIIEPDDNYIEFPRHHRLTDFDIVAQLALELEREKHENR